MTRDDVIRLAREAGMQGMLTDVVTTLDELHEFAALVMEECAGICERGADRPHPTVAGHVMKDFGASPHLAAAIRTAKPKG